MLPMGILMVGLVLDSVIVTERRWMYEDEQGNGSEDVCPFDPLSMCPEKHNKNVEGHSHDNTVLYFKKISSRVIIL